MSRNWFKFHLYYTQEKKDRKEEGVAWENEATLQVKVGGLFLLVPLSHSEWPPRILLHNGLSTSVVCFFYYNIIYVIFLLTKQNPSTTDQRRNRRSASGGFDSDGMSTLAGKGFRVRSPRPRSVLDVLPQVLLVALMHVLQQHPPPALAVSAAERDSARGRLGTTARTPTSCPGGMREL